MSLALLLALAVTTGGLHVLFENESWWMVLLLVIAVVLAAAAITRALSPLRFLPPLVALLVLGAVTTLMFVPDSALLGFLPTPDTIGEVANLVQRAADSIYRQAIPASADRGIVFVLCCGVGAVAVVCDAVAISLKAPAVTGVPLAGILSVPAFTARDISDPFVFALAAATYLLLLVTGSARRQPGLATAIGGAAIAGALVLPGMLPALGSSISPAPSGVAAGANPVLTLGDDLRRAGERPVLGYRTSAESGQYLRLVSLERFTGSNWAPTERELDTSNDIESFGPVPGLSDAVPTETVDTAIDVGNFSSRWLPVPYPARAITGLESDWYWEQEGFSVSSPDDTPRGQDYQVESLQLEPSPEQLLAAGTVVSPELVPYLELPGDLPSGISDTAAQVAGPARTNYEKALALQEFLRGDAFSYSEEAPVDGNYDGTGMDVLDTFLTVRSGYCVHFASAMAVMARALDIPARVIVGFLPGSRVTSDGAAFYEVTSHDLHSWPELYFDGIGWVQFEPTPGRGELGEYADVTAPGVPGPDSQEEPSASPVPSTDPSPSSSVGPDRGLDDGGAAPGASGSNGAPGRITMGVLAALLVSLLPALIRAAGRWRLLARLRSSTASALDAWTEVVRTAVDVGIPVTTTQTPRETAGTIGSGGASLERLRIAVEREGYGSPGGPASEDLARDVLAVRSALLGACTGRERLLARLYPASVWRRILHPLTSDDLIYRGNPAAVTAGG